MYDLLSYRILVVRKWVFCCSLNGNYPRWLISLNSIMNPRSVAIFGYLIFILVTILPLSTQVYSDVYQIEMNLSKYRAEGQTLCLKQLCVPAVSVSYWRIDMISFKNYYYTIEVCACRFIYQNYLLDSLLFFLTYFFFFISFLDIMAGLNPTVELESFEYLKAILIRETN